MRLRRWVKRLVRVLVITLVLCLGIAGLALLGTQTGWFKDWLRRYIVRESSQFLNGELQIGRLSGNLFFGVSLSDVALVQNGQRIITFKDLKVDYSVLDMASQGIVLDEIEMNQPVVLAAKGADGWNLMRLVKKQAEENKRRGPGRPVTIRLIRIHDGRVRVDRGDNNVTEITDLDTAVGFRYVPVSFTIDIGKIALKSANPNLALDELSGVVKVAGEDITLQRLYVRLPQTELRVNGAVRRYKETPQLDLTVASSKLTFPEIGPFLPAVRNIHTVPSFTVKVKGPLARMQTTVDLKSGAGAAAGNVTLDLASPKKRIDGDLQVRDINLAPWIDNETFKGIITGRAQFALTLPDSKVKRPFAGTFRFTGPTAGAAGYSAQDVDARGRFEGSHVTVEQARGQAYGAAVTAAGTVGAAPPAPGRGARGAKPQGGGVQYQFKGTLANLDLRRVPKTVPVPPMATVLNLGYDVTGQGSKFFRGEAQLQASTVEGIRIADGMTGYFELRDKHIAYGGEGDVTQVDLPRIGRVLDVDALTAPRFEGVVNGHFRVDASGKNLSELTLQASGTAVDSSLFGGARIEKMDFDTTIEQAALRARAKGTFADLDPTNVIDKAWLKGRLSGALDGTVTIPDLREDVTMDTFGFDGTTKLTRSEWQDVTFDTVDFTGGLAKSVLRVDALAVDGPDVRGTASGSVAFDETSASDLKYKLTAPDLARLGALVKQDVAGVAEAQGTLTGNALELVTTGRAHLTNVRYQQAAEIAAADADYEVHLPQMDIVALRANATIDAQTVQVAGRELSRVTGKGGYQAETKQAQFDARVLEGPRTIDAAGDVQLPRSADAPQVQEVRLSKLAVSTSGMPAPAPGTAAATAAQDKTTVSGAATPAAPGTATAAAPAPAAQAAAGANTIVWQMRQGTQPLVTYDGQAVHLTGVELVNGAQQITASGAIAIAAGAPHDLKVEAKGVDIAQAQALAGLQPRGGGLLDASATLAGTNESLDARTTFGVRQGTFRDVKFESFGGTATIAGPSLGLDVRLVQAPGAELTAKGSLPLSTFRAADATAAANAAAAKGPAGNEAIDLRVQSSTIDLKLVEGLTDAIYDISGTAKLDMRVAGQLRQPTFEGSAQIDNGAFTVDATGTAYTGLTTALRFEPSRLVIDSFRMLDDGNDPLEVRGELGLEQNRLGAVRIEAVAKNFELLDNEMGVVDVNSTLNVTGELLKPTVRGTIAFHTGRVQVDEVLRRLTGSAYSTQSLEERLGGTGGATTTAATPAPAVTPAPATPGSVAATPTTPGTAAPGQPATAGQPAAASASKASAPVGPYAGLDLDVTVHIPDNLILRGKDLRTGPTSIGLGNMNVTVGGDLRLVKQPGDAINVVGSVNTVRGTYDFKGRRFDILRDGRIAFQGEEVGNPALDVSAQRVIQPSGIEARIRIQGTARRPQLSFSSTPPLEESDVIALIVFNRPLNTLQSGEQASIAEFAGATAAGFVVSPLTESLGRALNLDLLEVQTTTDTGTGGTVTVGQQIGEDIFFKFQQQFGSQAVSEFILEYQFARFMRLRASHAEGEGVGRPTRSLTRRVQRDGVDLIFYFSY